MSTPIDGTHGLARLIQNATISQIATAIFTIVFVRWVVRGIYRVYFHPLSHFPGPKFAAFTRIPQIMAVWSGSVHHRMSKLHREYGEVVRTAPDEISFINPQVWRDAYGHGAKGAPGSTPTKNWRRYGKAVNGYHSLIQARDADHTRMRRIFNPAFSDRALKQQEPLFMKYVDKLVQSLNVGIEEDPGRTFDMVRLYNFTTFDVMGDLTFGEPLHMLDNAEYDPWVSIIFGGIKMGSRISILHHYPILYKAFKKLVSEKITKKRHDHFQFSVQRVTKRLEKGRASEGVDLWDLVLAQEEGKGLDRGEMDSNAGLFMLAGTETTATLVSGLTYYLLKNPGPMKKLVEELRGSFSTSADINMEAIAALPYLNACIKEGLRRYPPVATGLPRLTPPDGSTICGRYVPGGFCVTAPHFAMYNSEMLWKDPQSFIPERWLGDERFADDQRSALQPFSVGNRDCLGKNMAYHEMRLIMAKTLYNFDLELCPESDNWTDQHTYVLWEKKPLMVKLKSVGAS